MRKVDGRMAATKTPENTILMTLQWDENFNVGTDPGMPVDDKDYEVSFRFAGKPTLAIDLETALGRDHRFGA